MQIRDIDIIVLDLDWTLEIECAAILYFEYQWVLHVNRAFVSESMSLSNYFLAQKKMWNLE